MEQESVVGVILAGGYATRLWPFTKNRAKVLLPLDLETVVMDKQLQEMDKDDRIEDIYVSTNERFADDISNHVESNESYTTPKVSVEQTSSENEKLGVVGALKQFVERENLQDSNLLILAGDNIMSMNVSEIVDNFQNNKNPLVVSYDLEERSEASSYGVINTNESGRIESFQEKPDNPQSSLISTGCYMIPSKNVLFEEYIGQGNNPDEPGWYMQWLQNKTGVYTHSFNGEWFDIGTPNNYIEAVKWWLDGRNAVSESATVESTDLQGGNLILDGSELRNCEIKDTVVFGDSIVESCKLDACIIDSDVGVSGISAENGKFENWREK